jgi:hypothetical protein
MERYDARPPRCVTPPAPRALTDETPRWNRLWSLPAGARLLDRNLDVSQRPSRWRPLWVAARSAVLPALLAVAVGAFLQGWRGIAPAAVFAACVAGLSGVFLDRRRPAYWNDGFSTAFHGMKDGAFLGAVLGAFVAPTIWFVWAVGRRPLHRSHPDPFELAIGFPFLAIKGGFFGIFVGGLAGYVASFYSRCNIPDSEK